MKKVAVLKHILIKKIRLKAKKPNQDITALSFCFLYIKIQLSSLISEINYIDVQYLLIK